MTELDALAAEVASLRDRVAVLEQRHGPHDEDDAALLRLIVARLGRPFTATDLVALRDVADDEGLLLDDLGIASPAAAGCWLRRMRDCENAGLRLERFSQRGANGYRWRVVAAAPL